MHKIDIVTLQFVKCPYRRELMPIEECRLCEVHDGTEGNCIKCLDD